MEAGERLPEAPLRAPAGRVDWVDHAKGICIFFVVMFHVGDLVHESGRTGGWLMEVVTFARPFRMPDFFLIAGLFLSNAMRRPWRRYLDGKILHFVYFYVLWMTLQFGLYELRHLLAEHASPVTIALAYLKRWIEPVGPLWFIHILPVFFLVTRILRPVPPWLVWLAAATLHSLQISSDWHVIREGASRYVFFYSGYILAPYIFRIAAWASARVPALLGYLAGWGVVNGLLVAAGWAWLPGVTLALGYAGAIAVIFTSVLLSKVSWSWPLRYAGENSIVVYLADWAVSMVVVKALSKAIGPPGWLGFVATIVTVIGTLLLWRIALRTPARFMYVRPRWLRLEPDAPSSRPQAI
jgi:uncharacterized membrane protein YcfT